MYPLNMTLPGAQVGFAVANDKAEHETLTALGYEPPIAAPQETTEQVSTTAETPAGAAPKRGRPRKDAA